MVNVMLVECVLVVACVLVHVEWVLKFDCCF